MKRPAKSPPKLSPTRMRWLNTQVANGRFENISEALNFCVGQAARAESAREELERKLARSAAGPSRRVDEKWWTAIHAAVDSRRRASARKKSA
jgi:Arc/MetJ-type ribon-helix-helix transcriptional regulator